MELHKALANPCHTKKTIRRLALANRGSASRYVDPATGETALHVACRLRCRRAIVAFLHKNLPRAIHARDHEGRLPLHAACSCREPDSTVIGLLSSLYERAWATASYNGEYPLHVLLTLVPPAAGSTAAAVRKANRIFCNDSLRTIILRHAKHCETAAARPSPRTGEYPLHMYLRRLVVGSQSGRDLTWTGPNDCEAVRRLVEIFPEATGIRAAADGKFPIHLACQASCDLSAIQAMSKATIAQPCAEGHFPVHYAFTCRQPKQSVILYLCTEHPEALMKRPTTSPLSLSSSSSPSSSPCSLALRRQRMRRKKFWIVSTGLFFVALLIGALGAVPRTPAEHGKLAERGLLLGRDDNSSSRSFWNGNKKKSHCRNLWWTHFSGPGRLVDTKMNVNKPERRSNCASKQQGFYK